MSPLGHNGYSFDDVVAENLERGLYWAQRDSLIRIIRDPEMTNRHEIVLAEIVAMTNAETGTCYPGRRHLSEATGYTEGTIATTIKELVAAGYLVSTRRAPQPGTRALAHYAIVKPTVEELRAAVEAHIASIRAANTRSKESSSRWPDVKPVIHLRKSNVDPVVHVNGSDVNPGIHVNEDEVKPVIHVNEPQMALCSEADVNPVVPTVTSIDSSLTFNNNINSEKPAKAKKPPRGTRLDPQWKIRDTPEWGRWATENFSVRPSEVERLAEEFRDFWIAQPGAKALKADWFATFRNRCRQVFAKRSKHVESAELLALDAAVEEPSEHARQIEIVRRQREQERAKHARD